jgi:hypothetical protein
MIPPLVSKVKPFHVADFDADRDCSMVEAAPVAQLLRIAKSGHQGSFAGWLRDPLSSPFSLSGLAEDRSTNCMLLLHRRLDLQTPAPPVGNNPSACLRRSRRMTGSGNDPLGLVEML